MAPRLRSREQELRDAIDKARLPARDYRIYMALFRRAQWGTMEIRDRWQPRSLAELAALANMPAATLKRGLAHLEQHGWITRDRHPIASGASGGRGHRTRYALEAGTGCDCQPAQRPAPLTDAERARAYRTRRKVAHASVTEAGEKVAQSGVTQQPKAAQNDVTKRLTSRDEPAGQPPVPAKSVRDEGEGRGVNAENAACTTCTTPMDPVLTAAGYSTHLLCEPYTGPEGDDTERGCAAALIKAIGQAPSILAQAGDPTTGPCAHCREPCTRYGPHGGPLCGTCRPAPTPAARAA